jgi:hypothetical protein
VVENWTVVEEVWEGEIEVAEGEVLFWEAEKRPGELKLAKDPLSPPIIVEVVIVLLDK